MGRHPVPARTARQARSGAALPRPLAIVFLDRVDYVFFLQLRLSAIAGRAKNSSGSNSDRSHPKNFPTPAQAGAHGAMDPGLRREDDGGRRG